VKIHFDGVNLNSRSGPNTFAHRLAKELFNMGIELTFDVDSSSDLSLVFIEPTGRPLAKKIIQRLDGIWFKPAEFIVKNLAIKSTYEKADAVIWQSDFDRKMTIKWWEEPHHGVVIHNGINLDPVKEITLPELALMRKKYDMIFVCSSNWHPQKRLKANLAMFEHLRTNFYPNSALIVMGSGPDAYTSNPNVFFTGSQQESTYMQVFALADWMIHLAWADHCPNVVIEALSQNTPIICSDSGGTQELVKNFGIILHENVSYNYELADYDDPPLIDVTQVKVIPKKQELGDHLPINITDVADEYAELFDRIIHPDMYEKNK
jgi:glycosyltransferase involved in cell wall biosynthesis